MSIAMSNKENSEAKKIREQQTKRETREKRTRQLADARTAVEELKGRLRAAQSTLRQCDSLSNHTSGFYEEVDKLAKGKALLEVTPLIVEEANNIIKDAKGIVIDDMYLNRVKEFVPAGNNPVYPDVVVSIRSVRNSLARFHKDLETRIKRTSETLQKAKTMVGALEYSLDDTTPEGNRDYPTKLAVGDYVDGDVNNSCFFFDRENRESYFDFFTLDQRSVKEFLSPPDTNEAESDGEEDEPEDEDIAG
jgi:hypothetical protein